MDRERRYDSCEPGDRIAGRYEIVKRIGKGGMGQVYLAADLRLGRKLRAVKLLRHAGGMADSADAELRMLLRVNHPRLPQIVDYVPPDGSRPAALVTDYVEGDNLAVWFERRGSRIHPRQAIEIGKQLCEALAYLHALTPPIVHRDIKPANVMIDGDGFIRLIDLGIARLLKQAGNQDTLHLGTPGFAAPEQVGPYGHSDGRSDLYGLGAVLYYLLSGGRIPACGAAETELLAGDVPAAAREAVGALLQADPAKRPADAKATERLLADVLYAEWGAGYASFASSKADALASADGQAPRIVAVAAFAPGAGATFTAVTLGRLLAEQGTPCTLVEHPLLEPRLFAMLDGGGLPRHGFAEQPMRPLDQRYIGLHGAELAVQALHPDRPPAHLGPSGESAADGSLTLPALRERLPRAEQGWADRPARDRSPVPVCIVDVSGAWPDEAARELLAGCDSLVVVADPDIDRWTPQRAAAWRGLAAARARLDLPSQWIANKDARFDGRREWLRLLPERPVASVPLLPAAEWRALQYARRWATDQPAWRHALEESLRPAIRSILT